MIGRARAKPSQFIVMVEKGRHESDWNKDCDDYKEFESMQIEECHDELFEENEDSAQDDEEPYYANPDDPIYRLIFMRANCK